MNKINASLVAVFVFAAATGAAMAGDKEGASTVRPPGYQPMKGDVALGEKLFHDPKLSTNGMSCASCHANHGAYSNSFAQPYLHTVAMARDQLGRKEVYLDEMIQACMVMPMAANRCRGIQRNWRHWSPT